jgi:hypothetical protein
MVFEALGLAGSEIPEVLEENIHVGQEVLHTLGKADGQMPLEDQSIGAKEGARDFVLVFLYKRFHGVFLLLERLVVQTFWEVETPFPVLFGCGCAALDSNLVDSAREAHEC